MLVSFLPQNHPKITLFYLKIVQAHFQIKNSNLLIQASGDSGLHFSLCCVFSISKGSSFITVFTRRKAHTKMSIFLCLFFLLISYSSACDRCVHQSKASYLASSSQLSSGACGYGSLALSFNGGHLAAGISTLYRDGVGCGACFQVRCKDLKVCSRGGSKVVLTDLNENNRTDFLLSSRGFMAMARDGMAKDLLKLRTVDVEYKRIPCDYKKQNLAVRVEETSQKPRYLAVKFLYQGGQTDIVSVDVAQVGMASWRYMTRRNATVWDTDKVPSGPLQFRMVVTGGYDGKWVWAQNVLPEDWKVGEIYDSGVQISDIAQEGCYPCHLEDWK